MAHFTFDRSTGMSKVWVSSMKVSRKLTLLLTKQCIFAHTRKEISPIIDHPADLMFTLASPSTWCAQLFVTCNYHLLDYSYSSHRCGCQSLSYTGSSLMLCLVPAFTTSVQDIMISAAEQKKNNYHFLSDYSQQMSKPTCGGS